MSGPTCRTCGGGFAPGEEVYASDWTVIDVSGEQAAFTGETRYQHLACAKPAEPSGMGAQVEDDDGRRWTRGWTADGRTPWYATDDGPGRDYADITAVRVLSEGGPL